MPLETQNCNPSDPACVRVICFLLGFITILLYWPVQSYQFNNFDDAQYITQNPRVQNGLTIKAVGWAFTTGYAANWHPLTWISHMVDVQVFGLKAGGHHFTNLLFHVANTILLFLLLCRWTNSIWRSAFVAALFAWHPMHVESVAWVAERKDVLSAFFWLLTLFAYGEYAKASGGSVEDEPKKPSRARRLYLLTLVLFVMGLLSKPMLVSLPVVLLLVDYWPLQRVRLPFASKDAAPLFLEKAPFFLLAAASCFVTFLAQKQAGAVQSLTNLTFTNRLANATVSYMRYLGKLLWPTDLAVLYPISHRLPATEVLAAALLLLLIFGLVARLARTHPPLIVGWLWFFITLIPVIGLVQVGDQAMADRFTYIPSIGLFAVVAWEIPEVFSINRSKFRIAINVVAVLILGACLLVTRHALGYWRDSVTLFTRAVQVAPNNVIAECNLGLAYAAEGQTDEGIAHERKAIEINPSYLAAQNNLGILLEQEGKWDEAAVPLMAALKIDPNYDEAYYNLGAISLHEARLDEAVARFQKAISLNPQYDKAMANLGMALAQQGHLDEAMAQYRLALELAPDNAYAHNALGRALESHHQLEEAAAQYSAAAALKPDFADAHENLGVVLGLLGRFLESEVQFAQALQLQPDNASIHFDLGNALLRQNKLQAAEIQYSEALRLQPNNHQAQTNLDLVRKRLGQNQAAPHN
jgi:tetratricopeptide (TPR) repeat protein